MQCYISSVMAGWEKLYGWVNFPPVITPELQELDRNYQLVACVDVIREGTLSIRETKENIMYIVQQEKQCHQHCEEHTVYTVVRGSIQ